jgi:hypothetical protein
MLIESMLDDGDNDQRDSHNTIKTNNRLSQQNQSNIDSNKGFLLLDANEHLSVRFIYNQNYFSKQFLFR